LTKDVKLLKGHNTFEVVFLAGFVVGSVIRKIYAAGCRGVKDEKKCRSVLDIILVGTAGVGMSVPLLYLFTPWLDFANYVLPAWSGWMGTVVFAGAIFMLWRSHADLGRNWSAGWMGTVVFAGAIFMLWRSHADLGRNWSATLRITGRHSLVTSGVYRHVRHPMYTAHLLWAIAQGLILANWIAGWAFLVLSIPLYLMRIPKEEQMMLEHFGEEYREYMSWTGKLIPRIRK
jgi:protein-S-isoprenylcysteine O-methyltransferase Ste14